jgi:hypothetical protein
MNRKSKIPDIEQESTDLGRRGFLTRLGVAVAAAPLLVSLSGAASARVSAGGHDGDDGGHGVLGARGGAVGDDTNNGEQTDHTDDIIGYKDGHDDVYREHYARNYHDKDDSIGMDAVD